MTKNPMPTAWLILMNSRLSAVMEVSTSELREMNVMSVDQHTLSAAANKLCALSDKVLRDISKLLESLRHFCGN